MTIIANHVHCSYLTVGIARHSFLPRRVFRPAFTVTLQLPSHSPGVAVLLTPLGGTHGSLVGWDLNVEMAQRRIADSPLDSAGLLGRRWLINQGPELRT